MRRPPALQNQPGPPFDAPAARTLRTALGMGPDDVAHDLPYAYSPMLQSFGGDLIDRSRRTPTRGTSLEGPSA